MVWAKFPDEFDDSPAVVAAGPLAKGVFEHAVRWSCRYLTDGHVPDAIAQHLTLPYQRYAANEDLVAKLVDVGLLTPEGDGYVIVGFLEMNPSREEWEAIREAKRRAGSMGGKASKAARAAARAAADGVANPQPVPVPGPCAPTEHKGPGEASAVERLAPAGPEEEEKYDGREAAIEGARRVQETIRALKQATR